MFELIPQIILFLTLGIIIGLIAKNLPRIKETSDQEEEISAISSKPKKKLLSQIPLEKINDEFNQILEKFLRKARIQVMRFDSYLQRRLESLKTQNKPKSIFKVEEKLEEVELMPLAETEEKIEIIEEEIQSLAEKSGSGKEKPVNEKIDDQLENQLLEEISVDLDIKKKKSGKRRKE